MICNKEKDEPHVIHVSSATIPRSNNLTTTLTPYISEMQIGFNIIEYGYAATALCHKVDANIVRVNFLNYYMTANGENTEYMTTDGGTTWSPIKAVSRTLYGSGSNCFQMTEMPGLIICTYRNYEAGGSDGVNIPYKATQDILAIAMQGSTPVQLIIAVGSQTIRCANMAGSAYISGNIIGQIMIPI